MLALRSPVIRPAAELFTGQHDPVATQPDDFFSHDSSGIVTGQSPMMCLDLSIENQAKRPRPCLATASSGLIPLEGSLPK